ncbi:MAG: hypothetical protein K940chlam8_00909 [Chlamydiae bacterium]|nr:hypothetical protein [Chlamydiota bacterium]
MNLPILTSAQKPAFDPQLRVGWFRRSVLTQDGKRRDYDDIIGELFIAYERELSTFCSQMQGRKSISNFKCEQLPNFTASIEYFGAVKSEFKTWGVEVKRPYARPTVAKDPLISFLVVATCCLVALVVLPRPPALDNLLTDLSIVAMTIVLFVKILLSNRRSENVSKLETLEKIFDAENHQLQDMFQEGWSRFIKFFKKHVTPPSEDIPQELEKTLKDSIAYFNFFVYFAYSSSCQINSLEVKKTILSFLTNLQSQNFPLFVQIYEVVSKHQVATHEMTDIEDETSDDALFDLVDLNTMLTSLKLDQLRQEETLQAKADFIRFLIFFEKQYKDRAMEKLGPFLTGLQSQNFPLFVQIYEMFTTDGIISGDALFDLVDLEVLFQQTLSTSDLEDPTKKQSLFLFFVLLLLEKQYKLEGIKPFLQNFQYRDLVTFFLIYRSAGKEVQKHILALVKPEYLFTTLFGLNQQFNDYDRTKRTMYVEVVGENGSVRKKESVFPLHSADAAQLVEKNQLKYEACRALLCDMIMANFRKEHIQIFFTRYNKQSEKFINALVAEIISQYEARDRDALDMFLVKYEDQQLIRIPPSYYRNLA